MKKRKVKAASRSTFYTVSPKRRFRGRHLFAILLILGTGFATYRKVYRPKANPSGHIPAIEAAVAQPIEEPRPASPPAHKPEASGKVEIRHLILHSGDTLAGIGLKTEAAAELLFLSRKNPAPVAAPAA